MDRVNRNDYDWPAAVMLTTNAYEEGYTIPMTCTAIRKGDPVYLTYAFDEYWRGEAFSLTNRFTLSGDFSGSFDVGIDIGAYGLYDCITAVDAMPQLLQNLPVGAYTLTLELNAGNRLLETDTSNNKVSVSFNIVEAVNPGPAPTSDPEPMPEPDSDPELGEGDYAIGGGDVEGSAPEAAASVYDGYLYSGNAIAGTIQVKVAKPKLNKKTGAVTAKITASIQIAGEKKVSVKDEMNVAEGFVEAEAKDGRILSLEFGANGMIGMYGDYEIDGVRNLFSSKDKAEKAEAEALLAPWLGALNMVCDGGIFTVTIAKKGKVTVKGTLDGAKVSAKATALIGEDAICIPVAYSKKGVELAFTLWLPLDGSEAEVVGIDGAVVGKAGALKAGATFSVDGDLAADIPGAQSSVIDETGVSYSLLPDGVSVSANGRKWLVEDGVKAAKVKYDKKVGKITVSPGKKGQAIANTSGLKLTYKAKDGSFKGSFYVYTLIDGKFKKQKANVTGVLIDGIGYGTATIKKFGSWLVVIE